MSDPDSGDLLLVAAKDAAAFQRLVARWRRPVYALFERTREPSGALDATKQVFVKLYNTAASYAPDVPFGVWLYRIAAQKLESEPVREPVPIATSRLAESAAARTALFRSFVAALPPREKTAFLLARIAGAPHEIGARAMGISEHDFQQHVVAAMSSLRSRLDPIARDVSDFAPVDRLFTPESAPEPPTDLDARILAELQGRGVSRPGARQHLAPVVGVLLGAVLVALSWQVLHRTSATKPVATASGPSAPITGSVSPEDQAPPAILAVGTGPVVLDGPPLSDTERERAAVLYDLNFLMHMDALAELDPFFETDVVAPQAAGPSSPTTISPAAPPPESPEVQSDRFLAWRRMSRAERNRLEALDKEFRTRPPDQSQILLRRWDQVSGLAPEARTGLRRLGARISALDVKTRDHLKIEMRTLASAPKSDRARLWRSAPFGRSLTGQEAVAAEGILLSR